ncbi:MAG: response regulator [Planctomycetaceae bacterium]|nr:response regulator [Planctomycetaceae bacterium]MCA9109380.1 response regulator [Planctomycetaceae bacterium]
MSSPKILVADDSRTIRTRVRQILSREGIDVIEAETGQAALEQIYREQPMLAILDINMPDTDGYGVCQELQSQGPPWSELPIIFLTSLESHALEMLGDKLGAYLHKPVTSQKLLDVIHTFTVARS